MVWLKIDRIERFEWSDRLELTIIHSEIIQFVICNQSLINQTAQSNQSNGDVEFSRYCICKHSRLKLLFWLKILSYTIIFASSNMKYYEEALH